MSSCHHLLDLRIVQDIDRARYSVNGFLLMALPGFEPIANELDECDE